MSGASRIAPHDQPRPGPAEDNTYLLFTRAAFTMAFGGGFLLALLLPLANVLDWNWGARWPALAQAHGHLQLLGWAGLFIFGMAYRLIPRVSGTSLRLSRLAVPSGALLVAGLALRPFAQTWIDRPAMRALLPVSGVLEALAGLTFAAVVFATLRARRRSPPSLLFFASGTVWLVAALALQALWLGDMARDETPVLSVLRDDALVTILFLGFVLGFIHAVALRTMPTFYARPMPGYGSVTPLWTALNGGVALFLAGRLWQEYAGSRETWPVNAGLALAGVALMAGAWLTGGVQGVAIRLRPSSRINALFLRSMALWLLGAGGFLTFVSLRALTRDEPIAFTDLDAFRHMLALGVVTMIIAGMASLITPVMAARRYGGVAERWLVWVAALLNIAAAARLAGALLDPVARFDERWWLMAGAAAAGIAGLAIFARPFVLPQRTAMPVLPVAHPPAED
ncbi:MAG TPA: NnrS family protein [Dehalococcoidia bacterium]|nr:NnrS family protein [Dehalococcoidia bacterium]